MISGDQCAAIPVADQCSPSIFTPDGGGSTTQLSGVLYLAQTSFNLIEINVEPGFDTSDSAQFSQVNLLIQTKARGSARSISTRHIATAGATRVSDKFDASFTLINASSNDGSRQLSRSTFRCR